MGNGNAILLAQSKNLPISLAPVFLLQPTLLQMLLAVPRDTHPESCHFSGVLDLHPFLCMYILPLVLFVWKLICEDSIMVYHFISFRTLLKFHTSEGLSSSHLTMESRFLDFPFLYLFLAALIIILHTVCFIHLPVYSLTVYFFFFQTFIFQCLVFLLSPVTRTVNIKYLSYKSFKIAIF